MDGHHTQNCGVAAHYYSSIANPPAAEAAFPAARLRLISSAKWALRNSCRLRDLSSADPTEFSQWSRDDVPPNQASLVDYESEFWRLLHESSYYRRPLGGAAIL